MAFDDAGTEDDGPVKFDGFSSTSSENETPKQHRKQQIQQRQQQKQQNGTFSLPRKRKGRKSNTVESSPPPPSSFQNSSSRRRSSSQQELSSRALPPMITTTTQSSNKRKRDGGNPFANGSSNNHNHHQHSRRHPPPRHHHHQQNTESHRSPKRTNRTTSLEMSVARLPPPPPQAHHHHHLLQESDDTTTSTRHLQTNNTTTTEITSNVHLKRRAVSANLSICSDTAEHRLPHHPVRNHHQNINNDPRHHHQQLGSLINRHQSDPAGRRQSFFIEANAPYLSLIEGIQDGIDANMEKYVTHVLEGRQVDHPQIGRMIEVPFEAVLGQWSAEISPYFYPTGDANNANPADSKRCFRIHLRHHSHQNLGSLKSLKMKHDNMSTTQQHAMHNGMAKMGGSSSVNNSSPSAHKNRPDNPNHHMNTNTTHTMTTSTAGAGSTVSHLTVSALHPSFHRSSIVNHQEIADLGKSPDSFVGSISVVSFEGFSSGYDMTFGAKEISGDLLKQVEKKRLQQQHYTYPYLLGIQSATSNVRSIGISAMCGFSLDQHYSVLIAQDVTLKERPVVAMDIVFWMPSDLPSSPISSTGLLSELSNDNGDDEDGPFRLTEENLKAHTSAFPSTPYDSIERLWGKKCAHHPATTKTHHASKNNKRTLDNLMTANHMDIIPSSPKNDNTKKARPSSPKKKRRIKIRNTNAILARANEKASKHAAANNNDENKNEEPEHHRNEQRQQFSKLQAINHLSRMVTPHVPYSPPMATAATVPHFGQTNLQQRSNSHTNNRHHKNDDDGGDEEFNESDPINHEADEDEDDDEDEDEDEEIDDPVLIMTKHMNHYHRHHQQQETAAILKPRISSPLQQHTPPPQQQQNGLVSTNPCKDTCKDPSLPSPPLESPVGVGNKKTMTAAASSVPRSNDWKADGGDMADSISDQRKTVADSRIPLLKPYNPQEDIQEPLRAEKSNIPPSLPILSNTGNHHHSNSNSPLTKSTAAAGHSNTDGGGDTKDEDAHIKKRGTSLEEEQGTTPDHHLRMKRFRVQGHRCLRPQPYSTSMFFLAAVMVLLFLTFPKNYDFQTPISTTSTTQRTASIRSRQRHLRQKNKDLQFPPTYSVL